MSPVETTDDEAYMPFRICNRCYAERPVAAAKVVVVFGGGFVLCSLPFCSSLCQVDVL
jgi:hypothetical protein